MDNSGFLQVLVQTMPQTMGACLVGSYLSSVFYGVTLLQTYQYFSQYYGEDSFYLYGLVSVLTLLDTFAVISNMNSIWFYLIHNYANPVAILTIDWSLTFSVMSTAIVGFLVQGFYAYRVYILGSKNILLPSIIGLLGLASLVLAVIYMALLFKNGSLLYIPTVTFLSTASLACSLGADLLIASSISIFLLQGRQKSLRRTDTLIRKLVIYTINTGVITTACTIITLILGEVLSHTFYNTIFYFPLSKCYVNSMLAFLNARQSLRTANDSVSLNLSTSARTPEFRNMNTTEDYPVGKTIEFSPEQLSQSPTLSAGSGPTLGNL